MNIAHHMQRAHLAHGAKPAVAVGSTVVFSYAQVAERVACLAGALRHKVGLETGDRVVLALKNCPEYVELLYACWHAGLVAVPANAKLHRDEFRYIVENSGARMVFTTADLSATLNEASNDAVIDIIEIGTAGYANMLAHAPMAIALCAPDDPAWLFYTSGTTGRPKGATVTHRNLLACLLGYFADVDPGAPWTSFLHAAPMSHGSGLYGVAHVTQASCHVIAESGGFDAHEVYELIRAWPALSFFAAPTMVKRLLDAPADTDTSNLKLIMYGGGPMYVADCREALDRFGPKLSQLYGQGESPMTITALGPQMHADSDHPRWLERLGSVGVAQSPVTVRTVDEDMEPVAPGEIGEIVVKGDSVMTGYWGNPEATRSALADGWLRTGDVGSFDEDGFLTLKDRSKDMIISGGTNIYPREVEEVLLRHPGVAEVSVIGRPDREWGESVVAYVVAAEDGCERAGLDAYCLEHMARFKRPKDYRFIDALPKNNYGKVLKTALREQDVTDDLTVSVPSVARMVVDG
ncbi:MAG: AMP-binding protein [Chromatiales bacterium]|jgi:long-chain acyl-CoA synthetase|nr:AMP-binding protein [Chromatiales bacterium]